jgi:hypothetical protein
MGKITMGTAVAILALATWGCGSDDSTPASGAGGATGATGATTTTAGSTTGSGGSSTTGGTGGSVSCGSQDRCGGVADCWNISCTCNGMSFPHAQQCENGCCLSLEVACARVCK